MGREDNRIVRVQDGRALERLRVLLEDLRRAARARKEPGVSGEPVTAARAADLAVAHLLGALGEGDDVQPFSVRALQRLMAARTRAWVEDLAQTVAAAMTKYLDRAGIAGRLHVGLAEDGGRLAAVVIDTQPDPYPIAEALLPTIEA